MPGERAGPLTWAQQEWFADLGEQEDQVAQAASNASARFPGRGVPVDVAFAALNDVVARHEGLRSHIFRNKHDQYVQAVCTIDGGLGDLVRVVPAGDAAEVAMAAAIAAPFRIDKRWPVAFVLATDGDAVSSVGAVVDHSAIDAFGWKVLGADVDAALRARAGGRVPFVDGPAVEQPLDTAAAEGDERHLRRAEQFWRRQYATVRAGLDGWTPTCGPAPREPVLRSYRLASARTADAAEALAGAVRPAALYLTAFADAVAEVENAEVVAVQALTVNRLSAGVEASVRKAVMPAPIVVPRGGSLGERVAATGHQLLEASRFANFPPDRARALAEEVLGDLAGTGVTSARFNFIDNSVVPGHLNHTSLGGENIRFTDPAIHGTVTVDPPRPGGSRHILSVQHQPLGALMTLACHEDTAWNAAAPDMLRHIEARMARAARQRG